MRKWMVGAALVVCAAGARAAEQPMQLLNLDEIRFGAGPDALPAGARLAVLQGDPKTGPAVMVLKVPCGYTVPWHKHGTDEIGTVLSGGFELTAHETGTARVMNGGAIFIMPAGMVHRGRCVSAGGCTVELHANGPWSITYLDPRDDPRLNARAP